MHSRWAKSHQEVMSQRWMALLITSKIYSSLAISARRAAGKLIIPADVIYRRISLWCRPVLSAPRERASPSDIYQLAKDEHAARSTSWVLFPCMEIDCERAAPRCAGDISPFFMESIPRFRGCFACSLSKDGCAPASVWWAMLRGPIIAGCTQPANSCSLFHPLCGRFVSNGLCGTCTSAPMDILVTLIHHPMDDHDPIYSFENNFSDKFCRGHIKGPHQLGNVKPK